VRRHGLHEDLPHGKNDRLMLSGTVVRKTLSEGGQLPVEFSRPEVAKVLQEYYQNLDEKVEIKLHGAATGDVKNLNRRLFFCSLPLSPERGRGGLKDEPSRSFFLTPKKEWK